MYSRGHSHLALGGLLLYPSRWCNFHLWRTKRKLNWNELHIYCTTKLIACGIARDTTWISYTASRKSSCTPLEKMTAGVPVLWLTTSKPGFLNVCMPIVKENISRHRGCCPRWGHVVPLAGDCAQLLFMMLFLNKVTVANDHYEFLIRPRAWK